MTTELAPVRVIESRPCAREACGRAFTLSPDDLDQETCSRYCRSMLKLERSPSAPTPGSRPAAPRLMPGSELIGAEPAPAAPRTPVAAPVAPKTAAPPESVLTQPVAVAAPSAPAGRRGHIALGPAHPDYGKEQAYRPAPRRARVYPAPFSETRTCARPECSTTFTVKADNRKKRYCSNSCARFAMHATKTTPQRPPVRFAPVEASDCVQCGAEHQPIPVRPNHCSWACVWLSAAAPHALGDGCPCFACSVSRQAAGVPPLIGLVSA